MSHKMSIFFLLLFICSPHAHGQAAAGSPGANAVYLEETFFPVYVSKNDAILGGGSKDGDVPTEHGFGYDSRTTLGYIYSSMLFGLSYNNFAQTNNRNTTPDYEGKRFQDKRVAWGLTLGYFLGNWRIAYTHFLAAHRTVAAKYTDVTNGSISTSEVWENTDGKGYQLVLGYDFILGAGFGISPSLVYQHIRYSTQEYRVDAGAPGTPYGASGLTTKSVDDDLKPMITLSFRF